MIKELLLTALLQKTVHSSSISCLSLNINTKNTLKFFFQVASIDGTMTGRDLFRSRTVTPQTHSTESDPTNPSSQSQNSLPVIRMHTGEEDGGILSIRVPLTDKTVGSYDSPATGSSRRVRVTGSHPDIIGRIPRYGDMDQSTSSSTEPSLSLEDDSVIHSVARRKVRPLIRSKQIITEGNGKFCFC